VLEEDAEGWLRQVPDPAFAGGTQAAGQPVQVGPIWAAYGIAAALWKRSVTGEGTHLDVSDTDATLVTAWTGLPHAMNRGAVTITPASNSLESAKHSFYETKDGKHVFVALLEPKFWTQFCEGLGRHDLLEGLETDVKAFDRLEPERNAWHHRELVAIFRTRTRDEWTEFFLDHDLPASPVNTTAELFDDPQLRARGALIELDHPVAGRFRMAAEPLRVDGETRVSPAPAPAAGQHTEETLRALGYSDARIRDLCERGIVSIPGPA
jgi:crotonobetainyl-CoA:carnitine CoA-transferase CaiB-like acyl-CoA transferase